MSAYVGRLFTTLSSAFTDFNSATLSGAIDILVIEDDRGRRHSTPFHVRFGKLQLLKARGIPVHIELNGTTTNLRMLLGAAGEAYFFNLKSHASSLAPRFDLPAKAATQQLPPPTQLFSASAPPPHSPAVPSDFEPSCAAVSIVPSDLVPSDHRFDYCSDSDVELTRAERDGTAHVAQATHSPPPCMSQRADRNWSTAVSVSFAHFQLQPSLPNASPASPASPAVVAHASSPDQFSEALFDLPATPPPPPPPPPRAPKRASTSRGAARASQPALAHDAPSRSAAEPPETAALEACAQTSRSNSRASASDAVASCAAPDAHSAHVVATDPHAAQSPVPPSAAAHSQHVAVSTSHSQSAQNGATPPSERRTRHIALAQATCITETPPQSPPPTSAQTATTPPVALVESATQTSPLPKHHHSQCAQADRKLNGKINAQQQAQPNQAQPARSERHSQTEPEPAAPTNLQPVASDLAHATAPPPPPPPPLPQQQPQQPQQPQQQPQQQQQQQPDTPNPDWKREASAPDAAAEPQSPSHFADGDQPKEQSEGLVPMSLCANLITEHMTSEQSLSLFDEHRIPYEHFINNPEILYDPSLMFRIQDRLVSLKIAAPYVFSAASFREQPDLDALTERVMREGEATDEAPKQPPPTPARRFRWFSWSNAPAESNSNSNSNSNSAEERKDAENGEKAAPENRDVDGVADFQLDAGAPATAEGVEQREILPQEESKAAQARSEQKEQRVNVQSEQAERSADTKESNDTPLETANVEVPGMISFSDIDPNSLSLIPTSEQLMQLELKPGANTIRFIVQSSSVELNCRIFLWSCHTKIVISDVDGTITRSDVLGHLLPAVGRDWSQVGVAGLYSQIEKNGYKILYLTARPIGQASQTRAFLHSVTQGSAKLPNGPVLMSPNRLVESFAREVIRRRPHEFKIAALREVRSLFSPDYNPFHAGFGNRETDVISYRAVGLIPQRIFVVNTRGELAVMKARYESTASYSSLQDLVENVFPDISGRTGFEMIRAITDTATFNDWKWWKGSLPEVDFDALLGE